MLKYTVSLILFSGNSLYLFLSSPLQLAELLWLCWIIPSKIFLGFCWFTHSKVPSKKCPYENVFKICNYQLVFMLNQVYIFGRKKNHLKKFNCFDISSCMSYGWLSAFREYKWLFEADYFADVGIWQLVQTTNPTTKFYSWDADFACRTLCLI